ncbi:MAG: hypothetical protein ABIP48_30390 [Planctomycetota bacterium]
MDAQDMHPEPYRVADFSGEDIVSQLGEYEMRIPPEVAEEYCRD